jgi:hypothetical protein
MMIFLPIAFSLLGRRGERDSNREGSLGRMAGQSRTENVEQKGEKVSREQIKAHVSASPCVARLANARFAGNAN